MANHKRGRPKNRRAGCLMCKPHKMNGVKKRKFKKGRASVGGFGYNDLSRTWRQEAEGQLLEEEGLLEYYEMIRDED